MIISLVASMGWRVHHMDVKKSFLNGEIEKELYIEQTDGFVIHEKESHVCKLEEGPIWTQEVTSILVCED
jgi:hypothetical protein